MTYVFFSRELVVCSINSSPVVVWVLNLWRRSLTGYPDPQKENQSFPPGLCNTFQLLFKRNF